MLTSHYINFYYTDIIRQSCHVTEIILMQAPSTMRASLVGHLQPILSTN